MPFANLFQISVVKIISLDICQSKLSEALESDAFMNIFMPDTVFLQGKQSLLSDWNEHIMEKLCYN